MNHQDWDPVVLSKPQEVKKKSVASNNIKPTIDDVNDDGELKNKIKLVTKEMAKQITAARVEQKLSQKDLANKCNIDLAIINSIERATCKYNAEQINKIARILNIKIPRLFA